MRKNSDKNSECNHKMSNISLKPKIFNIIKNNISDSLLINNEKEYNNNEYNQQYIIKKIISGNYEYDINCNLIYLIHDIYFKQIKKVFSICIWKIFLTL